MELNKEIRAILMEYGMLCQKNNWTTSQMLIRSTYDTFRIQNVIEKLTVDSQKEDEQGEIFDGE